MRKLLSFLLFIVGLFLAPTVSANTPQLNYCTAVDDDVGSSISYNIEKERQKPGSKVKIESIYWVRPTGPGDMTIRIISSKYK